MRLFVMHTMKHGDTQDDVGVDEISTESSCLKHWGLKIYEERTPGTSIIICKTSLLRVVCVQSKTAVTAKTTLPKFNEWNSDKRARYT